jgi:hypothetical protein
VNAALAGLLFPSRVVFSETGPAVSEATTPLLDIYRRSVGVWDDFRNWVGLGLEARERE